MKRYFALFLFFWSSLIFAAVVTVRVPAAFMYKYAKSDSPVVSQTIYATQATVVSKKRGWTKIRTPDHYLGWVKNRNLYRGAKPLAKHTAEVINLFANIYREPNEGLHRIIMAVPFSTELPLVQSADARFLQVRLVGGGVGYVFRGDVKVDPKPLTFEEMLQVSRKFIGVPYTWGGVTSFGIDCSAFIQMLFKQMGVVLPRDTGIQASWKGFVKVNKNDLQPGDVVFFGQDGNINHVGLYLGNDEFINATTYKNPIVQIGKISDPHWQKHFVTARRLKSIDVGNGGYFAAITPLPDKVKAQMQKYTWRQGCPVALNDLAYLKLQYWGYDNKSHVGALIVNKYLAKEVRGIFQDLYVHKFPIQSMKPMYMYKGNDDASMVKNNTAAFNCRKMTDFKNQYSVHSYGGAIDINPLVNPYVFGDNIQPKQGKKYVDRSVPFKGKTTNDSFIVKDFTKHGWVWGGSWPNMKDYQHFEKPLNN